MEIPPDDLLVFNGIDAAQGTYLFQPQPVKSIVAAAKLRTADQDHLRDLERRYRQSGAHLRGVKEGVDAKNLAQAGWGIIFAAQDQQQLPQLKDALGELLMLRQAQAGERYREFAGLDAYRPGETKTGFLARHGVGPGPADPDRVPYYLLIVADPEAIPFTFQYQLDVQYAVGRIYFDRLEEYAQYARSLVALETGGQTAARRASFFGVQNEADPATRLSATLLVQPLAAKMQQLQHAAGWEVETLLGSGTSKAALIERLEAGNPPALLFTASHGVGFPREDARQLPHQGALLCQDWPGPQQWKGPIPQDFYYCADDVSADARLEGALAFFYACYGAGTPQLDDYAQRTFQEATAIAPHAFVARLPQRLLSHPKGGMLAVIGHVERAWGYSFRWDRAESQLAVFESTLQRIMNGEPLGYAMEYFNQRYAELSTILSGELQGARFGKVVDELALAGMWTANNDARSYVILGDPAARLIFAPQFDRERDLTGLSRPAISTIELLTPLADPATAEVDQLTRLILSTPAGSPEWSDAQYRLGICLSLLPGGDRRGNLRAAVGALQAAVQLYTREQDEGRWLEIQLRLADLYAELFAWSGELSQAQAAEQIWRALVADPASEPARVAAAHLRLADLYRLIYQYDPRLETAEQAVSFYKQAIAGLLKESQPFQWAMAHYALARFEFNLFRETHAESYQAEARPHFRAAQEIFCEALFPAYSASIQAYLAELD